MLDPYFSATKLAWLLDHIPGARARARTGALAFGTVDSFLIWQLTGGRVHATDATNAARTMLYDISRGQWDAEICGLLDIPMALLPEVRDSAADYGLTTPELFGRPVPILGVAGDQQAAALGQVCLAPGLLKATYGPGCFALLNTADQRVTSQNRLLTTIAYQLEGKPSYALEGAIFMASATLQWLREGLRVIGSAEEAASLAARANPDEEITLVPAFTGLGAPWWRPDCRGAIFGLTRATSAAVIARAALESVGFQTADLLAAMRADGGAPQVIRVDGGMSASDGAMQFLADILDMPVERTALRETTAKGAAWLAGLQAGICPTPQAFAATWSAERRAPLRPRPGAALCASRLDRWKHAVTATLAAAGGKRRPPQFLTWPPSAAMVWPVTKPESAEAKKATTPARSPGSITRGMACILGRKSKISAFTPFIVAVLVRPGAMTLTVIPSIPTSEAREKSTRSEISSAWTSGSSSRIRLSPGARTVSPTETSPVKA